MKNICDIENCTGCGACVNKCPKQCITLDYNGGFLYPHIDEKQCVSCGQCMKVCPGNNEYINNNNTSKAIAAFYKGYDMIENSTSGGIFPVIAKFVLQQNGKVYGAIMDNSLDVYHIGVSKKDNYEKMKGSKYIQSNTKFTYLEVKKDLEAGKLVAYIGTPCQIAGLKAFLNNREYENLITIDLVCHGVGSTELFLKYVEYLEKKYKNKIDNVSFRSKKNGYNTFTVGISLENGQHKYIKSINDIYMSMYYKKGIYRESCYRCKYATIPRIGDITLGDFAELSSKSKVYRKSENKGISLILLNNKKGEKVFDIIKNDLYWEERNIEEAIKTNYNVANSTIRPEYRNEILIDKEKNIKKLQIKYCKRRKREYIAEFIGRENMLKIKRILKVK